jgi:hypothetical protein
MRRNENGRKDTTAWPQKVTGTRADLGRCKPWRLIHTQTLLFHTPVCLRNERKYKYGGNGEARGEIEGPRMTWEKKEDGHDTFMSVASTTYTG